MKAYGRRIARMAALLGLLTGAHAAHALDGFGQRPTGALAFNQPNTQDTSSPLYLRYDYSAHKRRYQSLDTDHRLVATYNNVGLLLEQTASYPQPPTGKLWMSRAAFVVGARDDTGNSLHLGVGKTVLYGAQKDHLVSLLFLASSPVSPTTDLDLNFAIPASAVTHSLYQRDNLREADGEAALAFKSSHAALRVGYRTFAVRDAASTAGWFVGLSLYL
jgi:hypothetical protein